MKKNQMLIILSFVFINLTNCYSQQSIILPYLPENTSSVGTAMGGIGVAYNTEEASNISLNPAHLGALGKEYNVLSSAFFNNYYNTNFSNFGFQIGFDLKKQTGLPLKAGVGYMRYSMENVNYLYTNIPGFYKLGKVGSDGVTNSIAIGATLNYFVDISFGLTYKSINSTMYSINSKGQNINDILASAFDAGLLISIPILTDNNFFGDLKSDINANIGYSIMNMGKDYIYEKRNIPLGLNDRVGYSITSNFKLPLKNNDFSILKIDWTAEAKENLVETHLQIDSMLLLYSSKTIFSQYNILENLFLLNSTSSNIQVSYGMKFTTFDTFSYMFGSSEYGNYNYSTKGFEISTKGIADYFGMDSDNKTFSFIKKYIEISVSGGKIKRDNLPKYEVEFYSINLKINNINF